MRAVTSRHAWNRRRLLRTAVLTALAAPAAPGLAGCASGFDDTPDPLRPLWQSALADADAADAVARNTPAHAGLARRIAVLRADQAEALHAEVRRLNRPVDESAAPPTGGTGGTGIDALAAMLARARTGAEELVPTLPRHRAGLVGSVAAGCAAAQRLAPALGGGDPQPFGGDDVATGALADSAVRALQRALAAEHAAVWVYELVTAFLPNAFDDGVAAGVAEHRDRRDACRRVLGRAGVTPRPAAPAYPPPEPVTDEASAVELVVVTETEVAAAWHGVLERSDGWELRTASTRALVAAASRGTAWRREAGHEPAAPALPGRGTRLS